ncbi:hypothetical protein [Aromatoleum sp.]|uniref:hypothetical protein n=1 Tax=Aromatoleum sp. TaxID=2307007 RepID=UPI002FCA3093
MPRVKCSRLSRSLQSTFGALLSVVLLLIAISHLATFAETGITAVLLFSLAEIVIAVMFLLRVPFRRRRAEIDDFDCAEMAGWESTGSVRETCGTYSRC